jgi:hypothetical protein
MGGFGFDLLNRIEGLIEAIQYDLLYIPEERTSEVCIDSIACLPL